MNIRQMRQIIEINNCQSINKAAQKLYISQSSLTASINAAEEELGMKILKRSHSGIELTEFGQTFVGSAQKILDIYDELIAGATSEENRLRISCQFLRFVGTVFASMCDGSTNANFRYTENTRDAVIRDVIDNRSDIGIIVTPTLFRSRVLSLLEDNRLMHTLLQQQKCVCLVGPHNPLYGKEGAGIKLAELQGFPMLQYEHNSLQLTSDISANEASVFPHKGTLTISDRGSLHSMLLNTNSFFIGVYNEAAYKNSSFYTDVRVLEFEDLDYSFDTILFRRKDRKPSAIAHLFIERLYNALGTPPDSPAD